MRLCDCRTVDPVSLAGAQHCARDRVKLGLAAGRDVPLHRRTKLRMGSVELGQKRQRVDRRAVGVRDCGRFVDARHERRSPVRIATDEPDRAVAGAGGAGKSVEADEL